MSENGLNIEIGQWVVTKKGRVVKITAHDMPDEPYESIERYATKEEILENGGCPIDLEYRMYFFVPYNIMPIQQGIQAGHALGEYALKFGRWDPMHLVWTFLEKWKTFIIYNGGTTNSARNFEMVSVGGLNQIADDLVENEIEIAYFIEPDLNDALACVNFIADERVFNKEDYPDFIDFIFDIKMYKEAKEATPAENYIFLKSQPIERLQEMFPEYYEEWVKFLGGEKNLFLRELIRNKKFA